MNKWLKIGMFALGAALAGTLAVGSTASAQVLEAGRGPGNGGRGGGSDASLTAVAAQTLGMTRTELVAELNTGKTIAGVAKERGVDPAKIVEAYLAPRIAELQADVAAGRLTQAQADTMLANMRISVTNQINTPFLPNGNGDGPCDGTCDGSCNGNGNGNGTCDGTCDGTGA